ncbi:MAG: ribosome biogenesis GTPase Der [Nitrospirae bacterium]|nr:ribosome biogenesis GTPase Der [Nitrospirota bacterium]
MIKVSNSVVAIVGRPNVGKSSLFNRIIGKRVAIVDDIPGVTRDRLYGRARWEDKDFIVIDTGGFYSLSEDELIKQVKKQALLAIEEADIVIMLMDGKSGLNPSDSELLNAIRKFNKKILYVVNKIDGPKNEKYLHDFYSLGIDLIPISAMTGYGIDDLMEKITALIPEGMPEEIKYPAIAIVGRPNVGKSTLVNSLLGKERMIVSPVPGTTRDSVDSVCTYYGRKYLIIDTAGIKKRGKVVKSVERYSLLRTLKNIERCDVALIILDAVEGIVEMDQKIAGLVHDAGKGAIILFNKWDMMEKKTEVYKVLTKRLREKLWFMRYAPALTISATERQRITKIFPMIDEIILQRANRINTHELNLFLNEVITKHPPLIYKGKRVKLYYITQVGTSPPGFTIFSNMPEGVSQQYIRFLEDRFREKYSFGGTPIKFYIRQRQRNKG